MIGPETYKILRDLCHPTLPKLKPYEELCDILNKQFTAHVSVFRKRIEFYECKQTTENINEWYAKIKKMAVQCKFKNFLEENLKDKFVTGLRKGAVLDRLCEEDESRSLQELLTLALKKESSLQTSSSADCDVYKVQLRGKQKLNKEEKNTQLKCFVCGRGDHSFKYCKFKQYSCNICKKTGHLQAVCKYKNNYLNETENQDPASAEMFNVNNSSMLKPYMISGKINNIPLEMELDTGSCVSVISDNIYRRYFFRLNLKPTGVQLVTYNKNEIKPLAEISAFVTYGNKTKKVRLLVIKNGNDKPLFGRDLMKVFSIRFKSNLEINIIFIHG